MNNYSKVIELLANHNLDLRAIALQVAKDSPSAFVAAAKKTAPEWRVQAKALLDAGEFIGAIKFCREQTGWGLKESKDAVDAMRSPAAA